MNISKIQKTLDRICEGAASESDVYILFLWLRDACHYDRDKELWDLACFVSHNQKRNQGKSHERINKIIEDLIQVGKRGSSFGGVLPTFQKEDIIKKLIIKLDELKLQFDRENLKSRKDFIINSLMELLEGAQFTSSESIKPQFVSCQLVRFNGVISYEVRLNITEGLIKVSPGARIIFPLFD